MYILFMAFYIINIQEKGVCTQNRGYTEKDLLLKVTLKTRSFEGLQIT